MTSKAPLIPNPNFVGSKRSTGGGYSRECLLVDCSLLCPVYQLAPVDLAKPSGAPRSQMSMPNSISRATCLFLALAFLAWMIFKSLLFRTTSRHFCRCPKSSKSS